MHLSGPERARLVEILAANVPALMFADVVREQRLVPDFDILRKQAPQDPAEARRFIASKVVEAYDQQERVWQLAHALYRLSFRDDQLGPLLLKFASPPHGAGGGAWEAAIVTRANTMASRPLREFLEENEGRICVVIASSKRDDGKPVTLLGTGFLVGPDVVLTAYHTLAPHIQNGEIRKPSPGECCALFDYYEGQPLTDPLDIPTGAILVPFADDWLVASRESMDRDGLFVTPSQEQLELLPQRLDFALIRLAKPIGLQTRRPTGGPRRSWIKLSKDANVTLRDEDRIIIPQHPQGSPQQIDFGRYSEDASKLDLSQTRLRYTTETDKGTSGAPCFNQSFRLVGMHNASFEPKEKNQAIRIERILSALTKIPGDETESDAVRLWNTSTTSVPRVILGREVLLNWLTSAANDKPATHAHRVYGAFVDPNDLASNGGFGKTYTIEILRASRRGSAEPIVVLGNEDNVLPDNASDFIRALAFQLGINSGIIDNMPKRPAAELPSATPNPDKLRRWASEDVPAWFDAVLGEFRLVDSVLEARKRVETLKAANVAPAAEDVDLAARATGNLGERWATAWIVVTGLWKSRLTEETRDLLAGMIGGRSSQDAMPQQLRRLRWLFVGYVPDFLGPDQITRELLDPRAIGRTQLAASIGSLGDSLAVGLFDDDGDFATLIADLYMYQSIVAERIADPTVRLPFLQGLFPACAKAFLARQGRPNG